ncbi:MAG: sigma-70 family RNA polymerase sigma factor, partial [Balneola sp.]
VELREKCKLVTNTDAIKPMLFKIFRRRINHSLKKFWKEKEKLRAITDFKFAFSISPEQHLIEKQLTIDQVKHLNKAIGLLSIKEREAIYHYYYENLTYSQIAEVMDYSQIKTARSLVYKAIKSLRGVLSNEQKRIFLYFI